MLTNILRLSMARSIKPFVFENNFKHKLDIDVENLGLYFHIPFCRKICSFCPYYKIKFDGDILEEFYKALIKELYLVSGLVNKKKEITSVYLGGGTPALMVDYLPDLMDTIKSLFIIKGNAGIELHPLDINEALLEKIKSCGFDMISIGIQSFQDKCIATLGREKIDSVSKLKIAKRVGFKAIDVDLIFGIPGQITENLMKDFEIAANLGATQISTYPFIYFSYTKLKERPPDKKVKKRMLEGLLNISKKMGYRRSSVWTFSKKNTPKYSSVTRDNYVGFGPSAASLLKEIFKINTFSVKEYIKCLDGNRMPTALGLKFNERTRALYWLFWSSYNLYINQDNFYGLFSKKLEDVFKLELYLGEKLKYIKRYKNGYGLSDKGACVFHLVEQSYTHQYIDKTWKTALKNPWPKRIALY